jgi:hypothetical protein
MLTSQFQVADGRRFAPMWDEPAAKATFALEVVIPAGQVAYSNMPVLDTEVEGDRHRVRFATSPRMSSYLLHLSVGELDRLAQPIAGVDAGIFRRFVPLDRLWLAHQGVCSRREAEALIAEGRIRIEGETVAEVIVPHPSHSVKGEPIMDGWGITQHDLVAFLFEAERGRGLQERAWVGQSAEQFVLPSGRAVTQTLFRSLLAALAEHEMASKPDGRWRLDVAAIDVANQLKST